MVSHCCGNETHFYALTTSKSYPKLSSQNFLCLWYDLVTSLIAYEKQHPTWHPQHLPLLRACESPCAKTSTKMNFPAEKAAFHTTFWKPLGHQLLHSKGRVAYGHSISPFLLSTRVWGENQKSDLVETHLSADVWPLCVATHWQAPHKNRSVSPVNGRVPLQTPKGHSPNAILNVQESIK